MSRLQKIGLIAFAAFVAFAVTFSYLTKSQFIKMPEKPWHMQPFIDADSLTAEFADNYELLGKGQLFRRLADSTRTAVNILVDAWGVPFEPQLLREDFAVFKGLPHKEYLHYRLVNRTRHAEFAELRTNDSSSIYLFGGDSLEYGRNLYIDSLGYSGHVFCQKCSDSSMVTSLDSALFFGTVKTLALTTQGSRDGDREKLRITLNLIAEVARKHPEVRFIVQGTHRPTLGDPKIRRESFAHWVPAIVLN